MTSFIVDPASGTPVTQQEYVARYPWTSLATWTYDPTTNLWSDHTQEAGPGYYPQAQNYPADRGYERDRGDQRDRDREQERERERGRDNSNYNR